jgi:S-DNA-T family DNA segregation ATPase FtsK/SpoIIIE
MGSKPTAKQLEAELRSAYTRLAESAAMMRYCHEHYMDGLLAAARQRAMQSASDFALMRADAQNAYQEQMSEADTEFGRATTDVAGTVTALVSSHPWTLSGFGEMVWDSYRPGSEVSYLDGVRVGVLKLAAASELPPLPAVLRLVGHGHLLITAGQDAVSSARSLLQAVALRLAVAAPPGIIRFALADPAGQGQHLSAFLRLPASLRIGDLAVSEAEVETLLKALNEHVSEVNKTRLTNVYDSVEAYNAGAAGLAIPYHFLVVDGFPAGFTDRAAELLTQLARNGPRAGVYMIATLDRGMKMPRDFDLAEVTRLATNLQLTQQGTMTCDDREFADIEIEPDQMPPASRANDWLDAVAAAASSAAQDLPFARIAVPPAQRWRGDTTEGLDVEIGVDGKGEPVRFVMGKDAVQHGLLGGNTQMGKSNLLHVLINQLALRYSPAELELYLLDFKEVEFNLYLTSGLPHARVIASRTDREFGLSVLRRFHEEIDRRSRLCREVNAANLLEYRQETGQVLTRALVIMDEFQVLFGTGGHLATADRIAEEAGWLLADVAKRGAAFGLHLLLSTQSPGGSLTEYLKQVYEQMTLRVAVACQERHVSEAILGNESATTLTRPGDAIYADPRSPGINPLIRVARLGGRERLEQVAEIRALGAGRTYPQPVSFDPDVPADFAAQPTCAAFADSQGRWPQPGATIEAWLGQAIEIKPATTATFGQAVRSNLLIVGAEEQAHGMLLATVLSAAVQLSPADVSFTIADLAPPSSRMRGFFAQLADLPHKVTVVGPRAVDQALQSLVTDLDDRLASTAVIDGPERFFIVAGLRRWPDLMPEDEYGETSAAQDLLNRLVRAGPEVGIHLVTWADSLATAEQVFKRKGLRQFALRAALHLEVVESDDLLGVQDAALLAGDRALFRDTDWPDGKVEKFKPYSIASLQAFAKTAFRRPE